MTEAAYKCSHMALLVKKIFESCFDNMKTINRQELLSCRASLELINIPGLQNDRFGLSERERLTNVTAALTRLN